jgi:hypothetical protein
MVIKLNDLSINEEGGGEEIENNICGYYIKK